MVSGISFSYCCYYCCYLLLLIKKLMIWPNLIITMMMILILLTFIILGGLGTGIGIDGNDDIYSRQILQEALEKHSV